MPSAKRQSPMSAAAPPPTNGSILSRAVSAKSLVHNLRQKVSLYGENFIGKTTLACEWEKPLLLVSTEPSESSNVVSISNVPGVEVVQIENVEELRTLHQELVGGCKYKTIVLDSSTSLQTMILYELMGWPKGTVIRFGAVSDGIYIQRVEEFRKIVGPFFDLPTHTIITSHEKDHTPQENRKKIKGGLSIESFIAPNMGKSAVEWLRTSCGYMLRMFLVETEQPSGITDDAGNPIMTTVGTGVNTRRVLLQPLTQYAAQFRCANLHLVPDWIQDDTPKLPGGAKRLYDKIQRLIKGEKL